MVSRAGSFYGMQFWLLGAPRGSVISGTLTSTVTVGSGGYASPLTITATGDVAPTAADATGVFVPAGVLAASLVNQGRVSGGYGYGIGVDFATTGVLNNSGTISGGSAGTSHGGGGIAVEFASGGSLTNRGTIIGGIGGGVPVTPIAGGIGIDLVSGGTVTNRGNIAGGFGRSGLFNYPGGNGGQA